MTIFGRIARAVAVVVMCFAAVQSAQGALITVVNSNFETDPDPNVDYGGGIYITGAPVGWTATGTTTAGVVGRYDPSTTHYTNNLILNGSSSGGEIGMMDGPTVAFFFNAPGAALRQTLAETLQLGREYTLTVAVGYRDNQPFAGYSIALLAGGTTLANLESSVEPTRGTFTDFSLTYIPTSSDPIGSALGIRIGARNSGAVDFDNVRLDVAAVPEPSTLAMFLGLGGMGLVAMIRRRSVSRRALVG